MLRPLLMNPVLKFSAFARIRGREARHVIAAVRDPDPILLVDGKMEWRAERLARFGAVAFAALGPVTLLEIEELARIDHRHESVANCHD